MINSTLSALNQAMTDLKNGKMIILVDDENRENEGDMIFPAELITPEVMNFMIRYGTGIVCLSLLSDRLVALNLPLMLSPQDNTTRRQTPFTLPIDAKNGITTGVSAKDRVMTIQAAMHKNAKPEDLARPGHVYPLQAKSGGVLERAGHTEGAIDIVKLAGFQPAAVLCEVINTDGTMSNGQKLRQFAQQHDLTILSIQEIIDYRLLHENLISETASANIYLQGIHQPCLFDITVIKEKYADHKQHVVLFKQPVNLEKPIFVRIHSSCMTGDIFGSLQCDCQKQLQYSLEILSQQGGVLIYLDQEGRDIGLLNKIKAYAIQQTKGLDTVEANYHLGLKADEREYYIAAHILKNHIFKKLNQQQNTCIRLMTNNPQKIQALAKYGIQSVTREVMPVFCGEHNQRYLKIKQEKLDHLLDF